MGSGAKDNGRIVGSGYLETGCFELAHRGIIANGMLESIHGCPMCAFSAEDEAQVFDRIETLKRTLPGGAGERVPVLKNTPPALRGGSLVMHPKKSAVRGQEFLRCG